MANKSKPPRNRKKQPTQKQWRPIQHDPELTAELNARGYPWKKPQWRKAPKASGIADGWSASAEFTFPFIPRTTIATFDKPWGPVSIDKQGPLSYQWEPITITMSAQGWQHWARLHKEDQQDILWTLADWPARQGFFARGRKRRGIHNDLKELCLYNVRLFGSRLKVWPRLVDKGDPMRERIIQHIRKDGFTDKFLAKPLNLAAYILKRSWEVGAPHVGIDPAWPLKNDPTVDPEAFFKEHIKPSPKELSKIDHQIIETFVREVMDAQVPILTLPPEWGSSLPSGFPFPFQPRRPNKL